jgi:polysaccharide pyruvyl transferase WcaK-like protein
MIIPNEMTKETHNDMIVANEIHAEVPKHHCEVLDMRELRAEQIKGVIQQCDAIVAARYHTVIAALSLGVPVVAVSWHHKYAQALGLFGQERYLCDVKECRADNLIGQFDSLWQNREQVRKEILSRLSDIQERVDAGARRVCTLLQTENRRTAV